MSSYKPKPPVREVTTSQHKTLVELLQTGDPITINDIKETATGPLIQYVIQNISQMTDPGKRADASMKLIDLVHRHSTVTEKDAATDYKSFLNGIK